jgi:hypothetical protein
VLTMCVSKLTRHSCGHLVEEYMNDHCHCDLLVGQKVESDVACCDSLSSPWDLCVLEDERETEKESKGKTEHKHGGHSKAQTNVKS